MGQYWEFFNVSKRQRMDTNGGPKWSFLQYKQGFLVRSITMPYSSPKLERHLKRLSSTVTPPAINNQGLLSLPDDVLLTILELPDITFDDLAILAVTCRRLFDLSAKMLEEGRNYMSASWLGCRIVCMGDNTVEDDLPPALLNAEERAIIDAKIKEGKYANYGGLELLDPGASTLYRGAFTYFYSYLQKFNSDADREAFEAVVGVAFPPKRRDWILCNCTKKEYVRASAIAELSGKPNDAQPFLPRCRLDLGHALLARICWSTEELVNTPPKLKMHRGAWVGDRFCITTMERMGGPKEGEESWESEWKDVSKQVVKDLVQIYRKQLGKEWLEEIEGDVPPVDYAEYFWFGSDGDDKVASTGRYTRQRRPSICSLF
ncbi:hypothetical protein L226DRAFT_613106 [Lentinus tigrinus ALCF2SS1-7]|uniref:F-box domain-containing protein n=1 Tax=Lentinus tigrinus ALCF2SS1-6 TaxID=1328759 RepID=A0A5C2SA51_9APHY|nr:hypothetical protein L227DRAFT_601081 [Lentinus tigrinus ALCF2SS1-6]RPD74859.1 hypothetical protein L226DRAFT_613106 [Lentinus tigrinus ALCF2SS1-7]